jgi:hypothetical protein
VAGQIVQPPDGGQALGLLFAAGLLLALGAWLIGADRPNAASGGGGVSSTAGVAAFCWQGPPDRGSARAGRSAVFRPARGGERTVVNGGGRAAGRGTPVLVNSPTGT